MLTGYLHCKYHFRPGTLHYQPTLGRNFDHIVDNPGWPTLFGNFGQFVAVGNLVEGNRMAVVGTG